ncbi:hypothetical protein ACQEWB_16930 [Streptomyces sp. CA-249302]|uniref:hypothetical protein n=1 Tax=Streptomyces sp. CA-249302 TaxID=3240058 RepID=UPI003D91BADD
MRGMGAVTAVIAAAVVLTACGGEKGGTDGRADAGVSTSASAAVSRDTLREDIRAAVGAGGFGQPGFVAAKNLLGPCDVGAFVRVGGEPDATAVGKVAAALKGRGWEESLRRSSGAIDQWALEKQGWLLTLSSGTVSLKAVSSGPASEEQARAKPFQGLVLRGVGPCRT